MSTAHDPTTERPRQSPAGRRKGSAGKTWKMIGFALVALGAGLIGAGKYVPAVTDALAWLGIGGGSLALAGLVMLGVASMHGSLDSVRDATHDDTPLIEQTAADVLDVRSSLDKLQSQNEDFARELDAIRTKVYQPPPPPPPPPAVPESALAHSDALFHLATSLDKLGARFDTRLEAHHTSLQGKFEQLNSRFEETRRDFESRIAAVPPAHLVPSEPLARTRSDEQDLEDEQDRDDEPALDDDTEPQSADELVRSAGDAEPDADAPSSLGLLDTLGADKQHGTPSLRSLPLENAQAPAPAPLSTPSLPKLSAKAPAAPSGGTWDQQLMVEPPSATPAAGAEDTERKLGQLRELLSDARLRAALESMRKSG